MRTELVMRSHNDMPLVAETLAQVSRQSVAVDLLIFDHDSHDGTLDEARRYAHRIVHVPSNAYVPGRILNDAMRRTEGELVAFLNADCTPTNGRWLAALLAGFDDPTVAAVFGRQVARCDHHPLHAKDTDESYGDGHRQKKWRHCFSMAASAIRRSVWEQVPFDESLTYSEDVDWTWRVRQLGFDIRYVPGAVAIHSHDYGLREIYRRQFGEGRAEAKIFDWSPWQRSLVRYSLLPLARRLASDGLYALRERAPRAALDAPLFRLTEAVARRRGFRAGWRERFTDEERPC